MKVYYVLSLVLICTSLPLSAAEPISIRYPILEDDKFRVRRGYYLALLELAVEKASVPVVKEAVLLPEIRQDRAILLLQEGRIDVFWMMTNKERERELLPIRIPIYRGLSGWRIMLIHEDNQDVFTQLSATDDIKKLLGAQGHDWPDGDILEANQYKLIRSHTWSGLFDLIRFRRADYFPRSVIEIHHELDERPNMELLIESSILFRYPAAYYYFVSKDNKKVASVIENGLNIAIKDGSFQRLFMKFHEAAIRKSALHKRKVLTLQNDHLPGKTPLNRKALWFSLDEL